MGRTARLEKKIVKLFFVMAEVIDGKSRKNFSHNKNIESALSKCNGADIFSINLKHGYLAIHDLQLIYIL